MAVSTTTGYVQSGSLTSRPVASPFEELGGARDGLGQAQPPAGGDDGRGVLDLRGDGDDVAHILESSFIQERLRPRSS